MDGTITPVGPPPAQNRSTSPVSYKVATLKTGVPPNLVPRPTAMNIHTLVSILCDRVTGILLYQSADVGYMGMVEKGTVYALMGT